MIIGPPRSGTAWSANWLTCDDRLCLHDPLYDHHYRDLDAIDIPSKQMGVACTGLALFHEWVNDHPAPKVILHRDRAEVNRSVAAIGFPPVPHALFEGLDMLHGLHVPWTDLWRSPQHIWNHLCIDPFDRHRHGLLATMNVTANVHTRVQNMDVLRRMREEGFDFNAAHS